jgi:processive 1,2-diacylglycerol beta-glucosyltransferase
MNPDAIVCTQQFPLLVVRALRHQGRISQPYYVVITDFAAHSSWLNEDVEAYFVGSEFTRNALIASGIPDGLLHVTGIPVSLELSLPKPRAETRQKLGLPLDTPVVSLFGGGIRPRRVRTMVEALLATYRDPLVCVTVAGRNERMAEALDGLESSPHVELRKNACIDYVDDLVAASDVVATKPGGMIASEILARGTPMIVVDPIPGQEDWNADFVTSVGAGIQVRRPEMAPAAIRGLLGQPGRLEAMRARARRVGRPNAALDIARHILAQFSR